MAGSTAGSPDLYDWKTVVDETFGSGFESDESGPGFVGSGFALAFGAIGSVDAVLLDLKK